MSEQKTKAECEFTVTNIGGISSCSVEVPPGVTVFAGENATNRTSFLQAIMAAMGSEEVSLKADADDGGVELSLGGETYERTLRRTKNTVHYEGDPYLDDPTVADLFAFLLETNEARQAVARGDDLREIIMRPVDIDTIKSEIRDLEQQKSEINDRLAQIESQKQKLPDLQQKYNEIKDEIADKKDKLADIEGDLDEEEKDIEESRKAKEELESKLEELRSTRSDLEAVRRNIESQSDGIQSLKNERVELEDELEDLPRLRWVNTSN